MERRRSFSKDDQSLAPLVELSPLLFVDSSGKIRAHDKIDTPLDEFGIPRRAELVRQVLGTLATEHWWSGGYDVHHAAWPRSNYQDIKDSQLEVGAIYRGAGLLKVRLPRQLHNYVHRITNQPPVPDFAAMRQFAEEHDQVNRLYDTVKVSSFDGYPSLADLPFEDQEELRQSSFQKKLEVMKDGELGVMPDRDYLYDLEMTEARGALRAIARAKGFSNAKRCRQSFFAAA